MHRESFDEVAELYDEVRPGYPEEIVREILESLGAERPIRVFEIGCGTGQLTVPLARAGLSIDALDLGRHMLALASRRLAEYPLVRLHCGSFEEWAAPTGAYDLVVSAQAFHWIEPESGLLKAATLLRENGVLALLWNLQERSTSTSFWRATAPLYDHYCPGKRAGRPPLASQVDACRKALENCAEFGSVRECRRVWRQTYSCDQWLKLLDTYSDHRALDEPTKREFFSMIRATVDRFGGSVERIYETVALMAHVRTRGRGAAPAPRSGRRPRSASQPRRGPVIG